MRPNSKNLAMRDPALASIVGAFGGKSDFGSEFGGGMIQGDDMGDDFGDDMGDDVGDDVGDDFGATALARRPSQAAMVRAWSKQRRANSRTNKRELLINPNSGSTVNIGRYSFSVNQALVLGTAAGIVASGNPDVTIRPQRVTMNAPAIGFVTVTEIKVANVAVTVGGIGDAFEYSPLGVGMSLDMPTLSPANRATVLGFYTGFVPPGFVLGTAFTFSASFKGPSSIVG